MLLQRSIASERDTFEVHAWGSAANPSGPTNGEQHDATQIVYQAVIRAAHLRCAGVYEPGDGEWADEEEGSTAFLKLGREFVFTLSLGTPILDRALSAAPADVAPQVTTSLSLPSGGSPEVGCEQPDP